jgi:hypothetical protein
LLLLYQLQRAYALRANFLRGKALAVFCCLGVTRAFCSSGKGTAGTAATQQQRGCQGQSQHISNSVTAACLPCVTRPAPYSARTTAVLTGLHWLHNLSVHPVNGITHAHRPCQFVTNSAPSSPALLRTAVDRHSAPLAGDSAAHPLPPALPVPDNPCQTPSRPTPLRAPPVCCRVLTCSFVMT